MRKLQGILDETLFDLEAGVNGQMNKVAQSQGTEYQYF